MLQGNSDLFSIKHFLASLSFDLKILSGMRRAHSYLPAAFFLFSPVTQQYLGICLVPGQMLPGCGSKGLEKWSPMSHPFLLHRDKRWSPQSSVVIAHNSMGSPVISSEAMPDLSPTSADLSIALSSVPYVLTLFLPAGSVRANCHIG